LITYFVSLFPGMQCGWWAEMYQETDRQPDIYHDQGFSNKLPYNHSIHLCLRPVSTKSL